MPAFKHIPPSNAHPCALRCRKVLYNPFVLLGLFCASSNLFVASATFQNNFLYLGALLIFALAVVAVSLHQQGKLTTDRLVILIFLVGLILRVLYILRFSHAERQHDSAIYTDLGGHMAYIQHFLFHDFQLPTFDPRSQWSFYHPPLYHFICALHMKLYSVICNDIAILAESVQMVSLFFTGCATIVSLKIAKLVGLHGKGYLIASVILILHPTNMIFSGSINNDTLCFLLMLCTLYWGLLWYHTPSTRNIITTALFMGSAMLAKTSAVYLAPALAFLFLYKFFQEKQWKKYMVQYAIFALISIPIGLAWVTRCYLLFEMPFSYISKISDESYLYIGSGLYRFFDFGMSQWNTPYANTATHNIFVFVSKSAVFGEWMTIGYHGYGSDASQTQTVLAYCLLGINTLLMILSFGVNVFVFCHKKCLDGVHKCYLAIVYLVLVLSFVVFCWTYPHMCTMDFRYIPSTFVVGGICLGCYLQEKRPLYSLILTTIGAFAALSCLYYFVLLAV